MLEQQGLCDDRAHTAGLHEFDQYCQQMDHQYEQLSHTVEL